jgi:hypothetical protein
VDCPGIIGWFVSALELESWFGIKSSTRYTSLLRGTVAYAIPRGSKRLDLYRSEWSMITTTLVLPRFLEEGDIHVTEKKRKKK